MSKKYVIGIKPEYEDSFKGVMILGAKDSNLFVDALAVEDLEELNSDYVNNHFPDITKKVEETYQRGLDDAWEAARRIIHMPEGDLLNIFTECYHAVCTALQVLLKYDAAEAIEKLKAYEEKQKAENEIKVGDEVCQVTDSGTATGLLCTVTSYDGDRMGGFSQDGRVIVCSSQVNRWWKKTGRHHDIDSILEEMKNG